MSIAVYQRITAGNFTPTSLDGFVRRQEVARCWRKRDGQWKLLPIAYVEDWDLNARRRRAEAPDRSGRGLLWPAGFIKNRPAFLLNLSKIHRKRKFQLC